MRQKISKNTKFKVITGKGKSVVSMPGGYSINTEVNNTKKADDIIEAAELLGVEILGGADVDPEPEQPTGPKTIKYEAGTELVLTQDDFINNELLIETDAQYLTFDLNINNDPGIKIYYDGIKQNCMTDVAGPNYSGQRHILCKNSTNNLIKLLDRTNVADFLLSINSTLDKYDYHEFMIYGFDYDSSDSVYVWNRDLNINSEVWCTFKSSGLTFARIPKYTNGNYTFNGDLVYNGTTLCLDNGIRTSSSSYILLTGSSELDPLILLQYFTKI